MVAVIKYNAGNVQSVLFALERLGVPAVLTDEPNTIQQAEKVIFPGVGEANTTMKYLKDQQLDQLIKGLTQPVLGICLGMQLMCAYSEENDTPCLGIFEETVKRFQPTHGEKVPHMGWNTLEELKIDPLTAGLSGQYVYFVHSYYVEIGPDTVCTTNHTKPFCSVMQKDNFWATQFHPEKSGLVGQQILSQFLSMSS